MPFEKLHIQATVAADIQSCWDSYTQAEHITQWNFASDDWCCPRAQVDLRAGGLYSARMQEKSGAMGFDFDTIIDEVRPCALLAMTLGDGRKMQTSFHDMGAQTLVKVAFDAETTHSLEMQQQGWQAILDNYKRHTESLR